MSCCSWSPPCSEVRGEQGHNTQKHVKEWATERNKTLQGTGMGVGFCHVSRGSQEELQGGFGIWEGLEGAKEGLFVLSRKRAVLARYLQVQRATG